MDRLSLATSVDFHVVSEPHPTCLSPTDPEARGRRRRRDPVPVYTALHRPQHVEASTLRGRGRCRSLSSQNVIRLSASSRATSPRRARHLHHKQEAAMSAEDGSKKRRLLGVLLLRPENHRRSQSPSRSRSPVLEKKAHGTFSSPSMAARRRQRTQSRSRPHGQAGLFDTDVLMEGSSLRVELMASHESTRGQG